MAKCSSKIERRHFVAFAPAGRKERAALAILIKIKLWFFISEREVEVW